MTSQQPPFDPAAAAAGTGSPQGAGGGGEEPSPEEVRAYLEQVRGTPADQIVAEVASVLLNAVQVKLGRRDARLLLDLVGDVTERVRGRLPDELTNQLTDVLSQLRLAQVEAEREVAQAAAQGHEETQDLPASGEAPPAASGSEDEREASPPSSPSPEGGSGSSAASRLWVPGR